MTLAILSAPGSRGDVNPMIAIGRELRRRNFDVVISLAQPYAPLAEAVGLHPAPIVSQEEFDTLLDDHRVWTPLGGVRRLLTGVAVPMIDRHLRVIESHRRLGETVLVSHPLDLASRLFREQHADVPLVDVHLAPSMLRNDVHPPRLLRRQPSRPRWLIRAAYWVGDRVVLDPVLRPPINRRQKEAGLEPTQRLFNRWWLSPDRILAMYPDWFADDWITKYAQLETIGFPCEDIDTTHIMNHSNPTADQERPIVFTAGTAHHHCRAFFRTAVQACVDLGRPGILLSTHEKNFPESLPGNIQAANYLPLGSLLKRCALIVHHGGIGTTSAALAAGVPQIIRPMAYDQFDNASRVQRLGCGAWLRKDRDLTKLTAEVLGVKSPITSARLRECAELVRSVPNAAARAAERICRLVKERGVR